jgi:hypothetical protein
MKQKNRGVTRSSSMRWMRNDDDDDSDDKDKDNNKDEDEDEDEEDGRPHFSFISTSVTR